MHQASALSLSLSLIVDKISLFFDSVSDPCTSRKRLVPRSLVRDRIYSRSFAIGRYLEYQCIYVFRVKKCYMWSVLNRFCPKFCPTWRESFLSFFVLFIFLSRFCYVECKERTQKKIKEETKKEIFHVTHGLRWGSLHEISREREREGKRFSIFSPPSFVLSF